MGNHYLINARLSKRWTEGDASDHVGISKKTYRRLEAGRVPSMNTLNLLCEAFGEENPEKLGYILERNGIRLRPPEDDADSPNPSTGSARLPSAPEGNGYLSIEQVLWVMTTYPTQFQAFVQQLQNDPHRSIPPETGEAALSPSHFEDIIPRREGLEKGARDMYPERRKFSNGLLQAGIVGAFAPAFLGRTDLLERLVQAVKHPSSLDTTLLGGLRSSVTQCYQLLPGIVGSVSSEHLGTVHIHLAYLTELLEAPLYPAARQQLASLAAECSQILGKMYHTMQLPAVAARYYTAARTAAEEADNQALKAMIHGRMSILPNDHPLDFFQEALPLAKKRGTGTTYSSLQAIRSLHLSVDTPHATECEKALEQATTFSPKGDSEHDPYGTCFDEVTMYIYQGSCYVSLGKLEAAKTALLQGLQLADPHDLVQQTDLQFSLGEAYQQLGDIANACLCGHHVLSLMSRTRSPWYLQGLDDFRSKFPSGATDAPLQALDEHKRSVQLLLQQNHFEEIR